MLLIDKDKNITISYGDLFDVVFSLGGLTIEEGDKLCFSVKKDLEDAETCLYTENFTVDYETNKFRITIHSSEMEKLTAGKYLYDIVYISADNKRTLNFPARLTVVRVVHNA